MRVKDAKLSSAILSTETKYGLTSVEGKDGFLYTFDDKKEKLMVTFPYGKYINPLSGKQRADAVIITVEEALQMAVEIVEVCQTFLIGMDGYKKYEESPIGKKKANYWSRKERKNEND